MKKINFIFIGALAMMAGCSQMRQQNQIPQYDTINVVENFVIDENSVPIFPKKAALTTDTAQRFAIDLPKRCTVDWDNQTVVSVVPEEKIEMITETLDSFNFESEYKKENGWARILFPNITPNRNISFYDLAELTQYKEYRNMYKMACNFVHGSLFSSLESLDSAATQRRKNFWNTSPSNDGIEAITSMLKIYITTFIAEYTHKFSDKTYLENMLIIFLYGKELLEMDEEASM